MNDLSSRQWRLDTPVAFGQPNSILWPSNVFVKQIIFEDYAAQGNQAIIKDRNGKIVFAPTGAADLEPIRSNEVGWMEGFVLDTLTGGGNVVVYIK